MRMLEIIPDGNRPKAYTLVKAAMRDGTLLSATVFLPAGRGPFPAILERTCYVVAMGGGRAGMIGREGEFWTSKGYAFVVQDVRGRGDSDGVFEKFVHEEEDGFDTVEWVATQPWCDGSVGFCGQSYSANCALLPLRSGTPRGLKAIWASGCPGYWGRDGYGVYCNGAPEASGLRWSFWISGRQLQSGAASVAEGDPLGTRIDWDPIMRHLPVSDAHRLVGRDVPSIQDRFDPAKAADFLARMRLDTAFDRSAVPTMHATGWYDAYTPTIYNYVEFSRRNPDIHNLLIGPWEHVQLRRPKDMVVRGTDFGAERYFDMFELKREFFDFHLRGIGDFGSARPRRMIFDMHDRSWRGDIEVKDWFIRNRDSKAFFLSLEGGGGGGLTRRPPAEHEVRYVYDPQDPVYTSAGEDLVDSADDDIRWMTGRPDVLFFTTEPLAEDYVALGLPFLDLCVRMSTVDTDFIAILSEVRPDGMIRHLRSHGILRMMYRDGLENPRPVTPGSTYRITLDLQPVFHRFGKGCRIGVQIQSSLLNTYFRNLNTGADYYTTSDTVRVENTIYLGGRDGARLYLPGAGDRNV